jgi:YggT family protein
MIAASDPVSRLICFALLAFWLILLARVVVSFLDYFGVRMPATGPVGSARELLFDVTEPVLRPLRRIVPPAGPVDLSVLVAWIIVLVLREAFC